MNGDADFTDAHLRHWRDVELLFEHERWANADQLYGFSAECGLKAVMAMLGMPVEESGQPAKPEHRKHVHELWPVFISFVSGRNGGRFLSMLPAGEPFVDWSHHHRYASSRHFGRIRVRPHRHGARGVLALTQQAHQEGRHE